MTNTLEVEFDATYIRRVFMEAANGHSQKGIATVARMTALGAGVPMNAVAFVQRELVRVIQEQIELNLLDPELIGDAVQDWFIDWVTSR